MIVLLTIKDLNVPYEYILDKPLEIKYFNINSNVIFAADFVVFMYLDYNFVIKNRVDGIRVHFEVKDYYGNDDFTEILMSIVKEKR